MKWLENTKVTTGKIVLLCLYSEIRQFKCLLKAAYLKQVDVIQHYQTAAAIIKNQTPKVFDCAWQRMLGNDEFSWPSVALQNTKRKWPVMNSQLLSLRHMFMTHKRSEEAAGNMADSWSHDRAVEPLKPGHEEHALQIYMYVSLQKNQITSCSESMFEIPLTDVRRFRCYLTPEWNWADRCEWLTHVENLKWRFIFRIWGVNGF